MDVTFDDTEFQANLKRLIESQLPEAIKRGMTKACLKVEGDAKRDCPAKL